MVVKLNICFCNFDIEAWRTDLLFKLVIQLNAKGHSCHYYNYKHNIRKLAEKNNIPLIFHDVFCNDDNELYPSEDLINEAGSYSFGLNNRKGRSIKNNIKIEHNIRKCITGVHQLQSEINADLFVVWGGFRYKESSIISYVKSKGIKVVIFEYGYFRPYTLTFETKGLNYNNSLPRDAQFYLNKYQNIKYDSTSFKELVLPRTSAFSAIDPQLLKDYSSKKKALNVNDIFKLKSVLSNKIRKFKQKPLNLLKERYIFVPFQVETDSQIIEFSNKIKTMKNLAALVSEAVENYNRDFDDNIKVIFKSHPVDKSVNVGYILNNLDVYNSSLFSFKEDTQELIKNSELVITINSTVGIEALINSKNVITLGDAFYNIEGLVEHCCDYDNLHNVINDVMKKEPNFELIFKYIKYLRDEYFSEIYYEGADESSILSLCERLEKV